MSENTGQRFQVRDPQGNVYGPADVGMLRDWVGQGRIVAGMHIADEADGQWVEVSVHPALRDLFAGPGTARTSVPADPETVTPVANTAVRQTPNMAVTPAGYPAIPGSEGAPLSYSPDVPRQNVLGLISMIAGIVGALGLPLGCIPVCVCIGGPFVGLLALTAVVLGSIALHQIRSDPQRYTGKGMAVAGLSIGIGIIVLYLIFFVSSIVVGFANRP